VPSEHRLEQRARRALGLESTLAVCRLAWELARPVPPLEKRKIPQGSRPVVPYTLGKQVSSGRLAFF